jgi:hypothetical protein
MDLFFPRDDQRLFFEKLDSTHSLKLPIAQIVNHFSATADDQRPSVTDLALQRQQIDETDVKDLILSKIAIQREANKLAESPRQTRLQLVRSLRNLDPNSTGTISIDELTWALGPQYLGLNLSEQELQTTLKISKGVDTAHNQINYNRFVQNLNIRNSEPICNPFFDRRANQITRLKQRLNGLTEFISDPAILERRDELMKTCMVGPGEEGLKRYLDPTRPTTLFRALSPSPLLRNCQSQPSLSHQDFLSEDSSDPILPSRAASESEGGGGAEGDGGSSQQHDHHYAIDTTQHSDRLDSKRTDEGKRGGRGASIDGKIIKTGHFHATLNAPARTHVKYPLTVDVSRAHADHRETLPGGRRHGPTQPYDEKMLHHDNSTSPSLYRFGDHGGGGEVSSDQSKETFQPQEDKRWMNLSQSLPNLSLTSSSYVSTNDQYFTPLDYQPSKPVSRPGVMSDAMRCALERDVCDACPPLPLSPLTLTNRSQTRRRKRYERTRANLQSFKDHAELDKISKVCCS